MSGFGADYPEMRDRPSLSDQDLDRLLAGKVPDGADPLDRELAIFAQDVRAAFVEPPDPAVARQHLAAALAVSRLKSGPAEEPAQVPAAPWWRRSPSGSAGQAKWRRRTVFSSMFASLTAKIVGLAVAAAAATGGLAAAGSLPGPAQQAVASVASTVGINLPTPHHDDAVSGTVVEQEDHGVTGTVSGTVRGDDDVSGTVSDDHGEHDVSGTATAVNHGNCVSYAAQIASTLGLKGNQKGVFVSTVAQDSSAVSAKVAKGGTPDAACATALVAAKTAALSATVNGNHGDNQGGVTATATPKGDDQGENGNDQSGNQKGDKNDSHGTVTTTVTSGSSSEHGGHGSDG